MNKTFKEKGDGSHDQRGEGTRPREKDTWPKGKDTRVERLRDGDECLSEIKKWIR